MKIVCTCGAVILDSTDALPHKAHFVPDQAWSVVWDAIDEAIEGSGSKEAALMSVRRRIGPLFRLAWQCPACGRVYLDDRNGALCEFLPASSRAQKDVFHGLPQPDLGAEHRG